MKIYRLIVLSFAIILIASSFTGCKPTKDTKSDTYVVMLSMDAFRWDYYQHANTPNLNAIAKAGVRAEGLIPCFPSKTFPNHYSMATGLHPNNHGIVNNKFYDSTLGYYSLGDRKAVENGAFYGGEPIWLTAEKQGVKAGTYFWVGSEAPVNGSYPSFWRRYNGKVPFEARIDTVIQWLKLPEQERPHLIAFYFQEPDWTSHKDGPLGSKTLALVEQLDSLVGVLVKRIDELPIADKVNLMIVSDHGMAEVSPEKYIKLNDFVDVNWFSMINGGNPVFTLQPKDEFREIALEKLKSIPNLKVWERSEIPERYHYGSNSRIHDILIEAEPGYTIGMSSRSEGYGGGTHGYDNMLPDMHGIFYAKGPAFKENHVQPAFMNINLYPIIAHVLGLKPAEVDGNLEEVKDIFKE